MIETLVCIQVIFWPVAPQSLIHKTSNVLGTEPRFDVPVVNVTVVAGETAVLPCSVEFLGQHKVVWIDDKYALLTLEDRRIIDDARVSVERPYTKDWNLHIREVKYEDQGLYMCQINTDPVKIKQVVLHVQVGPKIIRHLSSEDRVAREGDTVLLVCNVTGVPHPNVTWYRHPRSRAAGQEKIGVSGEVLKIHNISRYCDDVYECIASNGVPPDVSKQIRVSVQFPPEIRLRNKRIGQTIGKETILECTVTASPQGVTMWEREGRRIYSNGKYRVEAYNEDENTITLSLRIRSLTKSDYGDYTCVASNLLGKDQEIMILYEHDEPKETTTPVSVTTVQLTPWSQQNGLDNIPHASKPSFPVKNNNNKATTLWRPLLETSGTEQAGPNAVRGQGARTKVRTEIFVVCSLLSIICQSRGP